MHMASTTPRKATARKTTASKAAAPAASTATSSSTASRSAKSDNPLDVVVTRVKEIVKDSVQNSAKFALRLVDAWAPVETRIDRVLDDLEDRVPSPVAQAISKSRDYGKNARRQ